jgi:hypothetical protein
MAMNRPLTFVGVLALVLAALLACDASPDPRPYACQPICTLGGGNVFGPPQTYMGGSAQDAQDVCASFADDDDCPGDATFTGQCTSCTPQ